MLINIECVMCLFSKQNVLLKPLFVRKEINLPYAKIYFKRKSISNYRRVIRKDILLKERDCKVLYITLRYCVKRNPFYLWTRVFCTRLSSKLILLRCQRSQYFWFILILHQVYWHHFMSHALEERKLKFRIMIINIYI